MKVVHVSTNGRGGGAGLAAWRLHLELLGQGVDSAMLCLASDDKHERLFGVEIEPTREAALSEAFRQIFIEQNRTNVSNTYFDADVGGFDLSEHPLIIAADIVHLHWVNQMLNSRQVEKILRRKDVFWTLHDMAAFTGGCHYSQGCRGFATGCKVCPQLLSFSREIPRVQFLDKLSSVQNGNLTFVALNTWMHDRAIASRIVKGHRTCLIPNGVDLEKFKPKLDVRQRFGLELDVLVVLFAAESLAEKRKGFGTLLAALELLFQSDQLRARIDNGQVAFLCAGHGQFESRYVRNVGWSDEEGMAALYSIADIFVLPSSEDNQPNTVVEALACGTPVIAFRSGGVEEILVEGETGFFAEEMSARSLSATLEKALQRLDQLRAMRPLCRNYACRWFDGKAAARKMADAYVTHGLGTTATRRHATGKASKSELNRFLKAPNPSVLGRSPQAFLESVIAFVDNPQLKSLRQQLATVTAAASAAEQAALVQERQVKELTELAKAIEAEAVARAGQIDKLTVAIEASRAALSDRVRQCTELEALVRRHETESSARAAQIVELTHLAKGYEQMSMDRAGQVEALTALVKGSEHVIADQSRQILQLTSLAQGYQRDAYERALQVETLNVLERESHNAKTVLSLEVQSSKNETAKHIEQIVRLEAMLRVQEQESMARAEQIDKLTHMVRHYEAESLERARQNDQLNIIARNADNIIARQVEDIDKLTELAKSHEKESLDRASQVTVLNELAQGYQKTITEHARQIDRLKATLNDLEKAALKRENDLAGLTAALKEMDAALKEVRHQSSNWLSQIEQLSTTALVKTQGKSGPGAPEIEQLMALSRNYREVLERSVPFDSNAILAKTQA